jgi:hypothetical protein
MLETLRTTLMLETLRTTPTQMETVRLRLATRRGPTRSLSAWRALRSQTWRNPSIERWIIGSCMVTYTLNLEWRIFWAWTSYEPISFSTRNAQWTWTCEVELCWQLTCWVTHCGYSSQLPDNRSQWLYSLRVASLVPIDMLDVILIQHLVLEYSSYVEVVHSSQVFLPTLGSASASVLSLSLFWVNFIQGAPFSSCDLSTCSLH